MDWSQALADPIFSFAKGLLVDLYVPRKCAATSECIAVLRDYYGVFNDAWIKDRLITSKDHASVQIVIADVDANGRALTTSTSFALSGQVRAQGEGDDSLNRLATQVGCKHELLSFTVIYED